MKRYFGISLACMSILLLVAGVVMAKPSDQRQELAPDQAFVDVVGDVSGNAPVVGKAAADTTWIATWDFESCTDEGWVRIDNRILNDGNVYWSVNSNFGGTGNIVGDAAVCGAHDLCWVLPDGYDNDWNQGICIHYTGDAYLSFDFLVDTEGGYDFLQVETDSACASFDQVDYDTDPEGNALAFRDLLWSTSGIDLAPARIDSIALSGYGTADTHCVYISFFADGAYSPADGLQPSTIGVAAVVDNVDLVGTTGGLFDVSEDFTGFSETAWFSFVNLQDSTPFGAWARVYSHITDNDICSENPTCAWLATDHTTPTFSNDASMAFGPGTFVIKNWWDEVLVGPWVSLASTPTAISTVIQFNRFPGNFFSTSRAVQNWSIRGKVKVSNTDTPAPGDSIDCVSGWGHASQWNSLSTFSWLNLTWDATADFDAASTDIQIRFRESDWQWINNASPPGTFIPGPGPYWDRARLGRQILTGPVIDEGIDARYQAGDAAPNDPAFESGPMYAQAAGGDIFGTTAFSMANDGGGGTTPNLIVGDSITVDVNDILGVGLLPVKALASIVAGPHAGKAPAPYTVGANGFFEITADTVKTASGLVFVDRWSIDMDDTYFRGGDVLRYLWYAEDANGGVTTNPAGLSAPPTSVAQAEAATGGLFEVNFLPCINWDAGYLARIAADTHGDLDPTGPELANSSQKNCILYYENINSRRRSSDQNRTSFMYTLDKLGYAGKYDVFDHTGLGNTNNALGSRMSPDQAKGYSLIVYDAGNRGPGAPILPDGIDLDAEKIDMESWFEAWNLLSGTGNPEHTLWIMGSNAVEERPTSSLYTTDMAVTFTSADQAQDSNPDVFGVANFTNHTACGQTHIGDQFALNGGCPIIRDYDDITKSGTGVVTHKYGKGSAGAPGAIVMHANVNGFTTIMQTFPWFDIRSSIGQGPEQADEALLTTILSCALPNDCLETPDPNTGTDPGDDPQIEIPARTALHQNKPNPFNPMTTISFDMARDSHVSLKIYDVAGRLVRGLVNEPMTAGFNKTVTWNGLDNSGSRVSSGVYFYRLVAADFTATKKMVVMK